MVPEETSRLLDDDLLPLVAEAHQLAGRLHPILRDSIGDLVRSMNCYYSNLIEGHDTHPRDIDRALANDFSTEPRKRDLQKKAVAHIHVQRLIDTGRDPDAWPASATYASWLHKAFCSQLPPEMLFVTDEKTGKQLEIVPGEWRKRDVQVGQHIPPPHEDLPRSMSRFDAAYGSPPLTKLRQLQTVGAVHHRLLWIHPFLDGNGRVARLMSHALFKRLEVGTSLWPVARDLARDEARYKALLANADRPRQGDLDGRGNLTQRGLIEFSKFFLDRSVDQIRFMSGLLEPATLLTRIELHIEEEVRAKRLHRGSFAVLREAVMRGEVERSQIPLLTGYTDRGARNVTAGLVERGMLTTVTHRAPLRLAFPVDVAERWFPNLYPANAGSRI
ncbi:Fic family protein [Chitinasiproducens palmae]|uniref:Fic family protein n=1 Tax=Chitinasiproducens palmae TaxID=1770053 RepID=A0A1H2PJV3_9BURK|nr:Fic family protein [Chitinasiproducens palmae]SDV46619.1 Fic family protein [Chitinasiproducens palmae]